MLKLESEDILEHLRKLQVDYLFEAEKMFGAKIDCEFEGVIPGNVTSPKFTYATVPYDRSRKAFMIVLNLTGAEHNTKDAILQLSHEVVHMLSPVKDENDNAVNYLEEGIATYFSKYITDRDTSDSEFAIGAIKSRENYHEAYELYLSLHQADENTIKKLRLVNPNLSSLTREDFSNAGLNIQDSLIELLLRKFPS